MKIWHKVTIVIQVWFKFLTRLIGVDSLIQVSFHPYTAFSDIFRLLFLFINYNEQILTFVFVTCGIVTLQIQLH